MSQGVGLTQYDSQTEGGILIQTTEALPTMKCLLRPGKGLYSNDVK